MSYGFTVVTVGYHTRCPHAEAMCIPSRLLHNRLWPHVHQSRAEADAGVPARTAVAPTCGEYADAAARADPFPPPDRAHGVFARRSLLNPAGQGVRGGSGGREAEARRDALERGQLVEEPPPERAAIYGSTADDPERHFLGWLGDVDPDKLFAAGKAWGITVVRRSAAG